MIHTVTTIAIRQAGIQEYWVIDVADKQLTVLRDWLNGGYLAQKTVSGGMIQPMDGFWWGLRSQLNLYSIVPNHEVGILD